MFLESWPKRFEFVKEVSSFMSQTQRANVRKTNSEYSAKCEDKGKHSNKHKTKTKKQTETQMFTWPYCYKASI